MELHKFERQLRLMMLLTQNRKYTLEELGKRLDMSSRNVYRYIEAFKMAGFIVRKTNGCYSLDKSSPYFKDISTLVHFTEEEAYILKRAIESVDGNTSLKQNLKEKLYKVYDYEILSEIVVRSGIADNVHNLYEAVKDKRQVAFHEYKSSNSHAVTDRVVEPFAFTANNNEIWCYEPASGKNKLFKVSRITSVEVLETGWQFEESHEEGYTDVFHISSDRRLPVTLRLGMTAANLLIEEFPLAEKYMEREDDAHWLFHTEVCKYEGTQFLGCRAGFRNDYPANDIGGYQELESENHDYYKHQTQHRHVPTPIGSQSAHHTAQHLIVGIAIEMVRHFLRSCGSACTCIAGMVAAVPTAASGIGISCVRLQFFRFAHAGNHFFHIGNGNHLRTRNKLLRKKLGDTAFNVIDYLVCTGFLTEMYLQVA